jgi:hypothetical protein
MTENKTCCVPDCGRRLYQKNGYCWSHNERRKKYGDPTAGPPIKRMRPAGMSLAEAFDYFLPCDRQPEACWLWQGKVVPNGYGALTMGRNKMLLAHRVAHELFNGPVPDDRMVLHSCDNRRCVNPAHLRIGTHAENMTDRCERGRTPTGSRVGGAILTADRVRQMREMNASGMSHSQIAEQFGLKRQTVTSAINGTNWKHVA